MRGNRDGRQQQQQPGRRRVPAPVCPGLNVDQESNQLTTTNYLKQPVVVTGAFDSDS